MRSTRFRHGDGAWRLSRRCSTVRAVRDAGWVAEARWRDLVIWLVLTSALVVVGHAVQGRSLVTDTTVGGFVLAGLFLSAVLAYAKKRDPASS